MSLWRIYDGVFMTYLYRRFFWTLDREDDVTVQTRQVCQQSGFTQ